MQSYGDDASADLLWPRHLRERQDVLRLGDRAVENPRPTRHKDIQRHDGHHAEDDRHVPLTINGTIIQGTGTATAAGTGILLQAMYGWAMVRRMPARSDHLRRRRGVYEPDDRHSGRHIRAILGRNALLPVSLSERPIMSIWRPRASRARPASRRAPWSSTRLSCGDDPPELPTGRRLCFLLSSSAWSQFESAAGATCGGHRRGDRRRRDGRDQVEQREQQRVKHRGDDV